MITQSNSEFTDQQRTLDDSQFDRLRILCESSGYSNPEHIVDLTISWANAFSQLDISPSDTIVEVGSGTSPKIIFALAANVWFQGNLIIVDNDPILPLVLKKFGNKLPVAFNISAVTNNMFNYSAESIHAFVANHFIDDLLAGLYASRENTDYSVIFDKPNEHINFWKRLSADKEFVQEVINKFGQYLYMLPKGTLLLLNHYSSRFDSANDIVAKDDLCLRFLSELESLLRNNGYSDLNLVQNNNLSWLTMKKES